MYRYTNHKDMNKYIKSLIKSGKCDYQQGRKHSKLVFTNGRKLAVSSSPSDCRAFENFKCDVKYILQNQQNMLENINEVI